MNTIFYENITIYAIVHSTIYKSFSLLFLNKKKTLKLFNDINLTDIDLEKGEGELTESNYAYKVMRIIFSETELCNGTFALAKGKSRKSKRDTLDATRTEILKSIFLCKF